MPLTLIDEVFYWTVSCLLTKRTWEIDQHMLKNNPEGKYLFGEVCFLSFFAPIALHGTLYGENGPKKSHLERSEQKSSENRPPQKCPISVDTDLGEFFRPSEMYFRVVGDPKNAILKKPIVAEFLNFTL